MQCQFCVNMSIVQKIIIQNKYKLFGIFFILLIPFTLAAQRTIAGRITDAESGEPIADAAIFFTGTTVGTTTDTAGYYSLKIPGQGSYQLLVSHVGYQPVFGDVKPGNASQTTNVSMQIFELEDVTVTAKVSVRKKDVDLFWRKILGKKPTKNSVQPLNPEPVYYFYNFETRKLTVTCRVPLQIVNHETGYMIQYVLNYFTHDYNTDVSSWEGQYMFAELEPKNFRQENTWKKNREKIYHVSVTNFIRAMYQNSMLENGFLFVYAPKEEATGTDISVNAVSHGSNMWRQNFTIQHPVSFRNFDLTDSEFFVSTDTTNGSRSFHVPSDLDVMLICFGKAVRNEDLEKIKERKNFEMIGLFRNQLQTPNAPVHIFPDNTYKNPIRFTPVFASNALSGLNMLLPTDYRPDGEYDATNSIAENEQPEEINSSNSLIDSLTRAAQRFEMQLSVFPQEKLHLHTDKPYYLSGERIWFRAHVVDAATHVPAFYSNSVFVELFDARDSVVCRVKTGVANDLYSGYINIPEDAPEGDYTIRAYTNRMKGLDEDYFFMKNIHIGDPMSRMIHAQPEFEFLSDKKIGAAIHLLPVTERSRSTPSSKITPESVKISINDGKPLNLKYENGVSSFSFNLLAAEKQRAMLLDATYEKKPFRQYIRIPLPDDDFDVSFYPEGGAALAGCVGRTAFKAMQRDGTEINVEGVVFDQHGNEALQFKTDVRGMGVITMKPERGNKYYAIVTNEKGQSKRFDLPIAKEEGYSLAATWSKDRLTVQVCQPEHQTAGDTLCLIVHTRGVVQDVRIWEKTNLPIVFTKDFFPSGVTILLLLTKDMMPLSERLVFVNNEEDHAKVECIADRDSYSAKSQVKYTVHLTDESGEPLWGNFSVAVTDDYVVTTDSASNILTSLLLNSDLKGNIPDPAYFFRKKDNSSVYALDLLMLTQGWRRYDIERIVRNDLIQPDTLLAKVYELSGTVRYKVTKRPVENVGVSFLSFGGSISKEANTDRDGRFYLQMGEVYDSTRLLVQTAPQIGRRNLELMLDKPLYPERTIPVISSGTPDRVQFAQYAEKAEQQYVDEHGTRIYQLSEVAITAPRVKAVDYSFFYRAKETDYVIIEEELEKFPAGSMSSLLMRIPGVNVSKIGDMYIVTCGRYGVLLCVDDMKETGEYVMERMMVPDVAQIDFLRMPISSIFGATIDQPCVIMIHTKRGKPNTPKEIYHIKPILPLGFQKPAEFYTPKYDTPAEKQKPDLRTTIHWQPNITTDENGMASFSFYTTDSPSTYTVTMEGMTADGKIIYHKEKISVVSEIQ